MRRAAAGGVVTLTINPAIDLSATVDVLDPTCKLRCRDLRRDPGGGGINVARAVCRLGGSALAIFPAGGEPGEHIRVGLRSEGVPFLDIPIAGHTRENVNLWEDETGRQFRLCFPGPTLDTAEVRHCVDRLLDLRPLPRFVIASGSLPPGVPPTFYADIALAARTRGIRFVLDTSGEPLRLAAAAGVALMKPSLAEFEELTGATRQETPEVLAGTRDLIRGGAAESVIVSLGARGVIWADRESGGGFASPLVAPHGSVGAGDSMVAAVVLALMRDEPLEEAVRYGVAAAAASVLNPGTALFHRADVERLLPQVTPLRFDGAPAAPTRGNETTPASS